MRAKKERWGVGVVFDEGASMDYSGDRSLGVVIGNRIIYKSHQGLNPPAICVIHLLLEVRLFSDQERT